MFTRSRLVALAGAAAFAAACGGPASSPDPTPTPAEQPAASVEAPSATGTNPAVAVDPGLTGEQVVEQVCSQCHSLEPPPLAAPPLTHLARHLRERFGTVDEAVAHVTTYAPAPDEDRSILPAQAIDRFGLMPPQPLPEPLLDAAARYIWSLADDTEAGAPMGMQMHQGQMEGGMGMRMHQGRQEGGMGMQMRQGQPEGGMGMMMRRQPPDSAGGPGMMRQRRPGRMDGARGMGGGMMMQQRSDGVGAMAIHRCPAMNGGAGGAG